MLCCPVLWCHGPAVHPEISEASRQLRRSVDDMLKWEDHKRFHVGSLPESDRPNQLACLQEDMCVFERQDKINMLQSGCKCGSVAGMGAQCCESIASASVQAMA